MAKMNLYMIGKLRSNLQSASQLYEKRLPQLKIIEIASAKDKSPSQRLQQEYRALQEKLQQQKTLTFNIALDIQGKNVSSMELAQLIDKAILEQRVINFFIGGADGLDKRLLEQADARISFGKATWPHQLVRIMLLEQIYRSETIRDNHPYHLGH